MASKEGISEASSECCMCGDLGLVFELFQCQICAFRSQHRYCSDLYPKAESYQVCNWCLKKHEETQTSSSISSSSQEKYSSSNEDANYKKKNGKNRNNTTTTTTTVTTNHHHHHQGRHTHHDLNTLFKTHPPKGTSHDDHHQLHLSKPILKKQRSPDRSLGRKRIIFSNGEKEGNLRMPKFDEVSQTRMPKRVFRSSRIPRYKLLEEVCR